MNNDYEDNLLYDVEPEEDNPGRGGGTFLLIIFLIILIAAGTIYWRFVRMPLNGCSKKTSNLISNFEKEDLKQKGPEEGAALLPDRERRIYNYILPQVEKVALGERESTSFQIPVELILGKPDGETGGKLVYKKDTLGIEKLDSKSLSRRLFDFDGNSVILALKYMAPDQVYWFGRKWNISTENLTYHENGDCVSIDKNGGNVFLNLNVSSDFRPKNSESKNIVDLEKIRQVHKVTANADKIIAKAANMDDYDKLKYYKEFICNSVDYNHKAARSTETDEGNPWQMMWVFDNDSSTKVVCEGYSKAFKYLCDHTKFNRPVHCYLVTGYASSSQKKDDQCAHMWNVVQMDDGKNYMVDLTSSDYGEGSFDFIFLSGAPENDGWYLIKGSKIDTEAGKTVYRRFKCYYSYDKRTEELYKKTNLLNLADRPYGR